MVKESKNTEDEILKAAEEEFLNKGYDGAKTLSIAEAAGVTHAMLHYYFRTKENLFNKVFDAKVELLIQSVISSFSRMDLPVLERLKAGIKAHFDFIAENPKLPRFIINELVSKSDRRNLLSEHINAAFPLFMATLQKELDKEHARGSIEKINIIDLVLDIVSLNAFVFILYPVIADFTDEHYGSKEKFFAARRRENVKIIMKRLKRKRI